MRSKERGEMMPLSGAIALQLVLRCYKDRQDKFRFLL
jgi:hypothetical protein